MAEESEKKCERCGADVGWRENRRGDKVKYLLGFRTEVAPRYEFRFKMWTDRGNGGDYYRNSISELYTTMLLCNDCAGDVFAFAAGREVKEKTK